jgi:hypothetical protein
VFQLATREADVYRSTESVEATSGDASGGLPEHGVGFRGSIARNEVKWGVLLDHLPYAVQQVQQIWINGKYLARSMVTQEVIDVVQPRGQITTVGPINSVQGLSRVEVTKG